MSKKIIPKQQFKGLLIFYDFSLVTFSQRLLNPVVWPQRIIKFMSIILVSDVFGVTPALLAISEKLGACPIVCLLYTSDAADE